MEWITATGAFCSVGLRCMRMWADVTVMRLASCEGCGTPEAPSSAACRSLGGGCAQVRAGAAGVPAGEVRDGRIQLQMRAQRARAPSACACMPPQAPHCGLPSDPTLCCGDGSCIWLPGGQDEGGRDAVNCRKHVPTPAVLHATVLWCWSAWYTHLCWLSQVTRVVLNTTRCCACCAAAQRPQQRAALQPGHGARQDGQAGGGAGHAGRGHRRGPLQPAGAL